MVFARDIWDIHSYAAHGVKIPSRNGDGAAHASSIVAWHVAAVIERADGPDLVARVLRALRPSQLTAAQSLTAATYRSQAGPPPAASSPNPASRTSGSRSETRRAIDIAHALT
jgi:hypothetical protein